MSEGFLSTLTTVADGIISSVKSQSTNIMVAGAVIGVVGVAYFAIKETPKVNEKLDAKEEEKGEELTFVEKASIVVPGYCKTEATAAATIALILIAHKCDLDKIAAYSAATTIANEKLTQLNQKIESELGHNKAVKIHDAINEDYIQNYPPVEANIINTGKGLTLCMDNLAGQYFYSDKMFIERCADKIRVMIAEGGMASKNDWFAFIGLDNVADGDLSGWNSTNVPFDIEFTSCITPDGRPCLVIDHSYNLPSPDWERCY